MEENKEVVAADLTAAENNTVIAETVVDEAEASVDTFELEADGLEAETAYSERREYERLIKTRFKALFAEDTQRMINKRFRKLRVLEERCKVLEEILEQKEEKIKENDHLIVSFEEKMQEELKRVAEETERRVIDAVKAKRMRPDENAVRSRVSAAAFDVNRLTKSERAGIAKRAANGEKIRF